MDRKHSDILRRRLNISNDKEIRLADLGGANLSGAYLSGADLSAADLGGANLSGAYLIRADLSGANLSGANLSGANLGGANLGWANLIRADLSGAYLSGADLGGAYLSAADLSAADLGGANLIRADLSGANLSGAYLHGANLHGADLSGADGLLSQSIWLAQFDSDNEGIIVYRDEHGFHETPDHWVFAAGAIIQETPNPLRTDGCGCGVSFATRKWLKANMTGLRIIWRCRIPWRWVPDVVVPYNSDGKARCSLLELIEIEYGDTMNGDSID